MEIAEYEIVRYQQWAEDVKRKGTCKSGMIILIIIF